MVRTRRTQLPRLAHAHIHTILSPSTRRHIAGFPAHATFPTGFPSEARRRSATHSYIPRPRHSPAGPESGLPGRCRPPRAPGSGPGLRGLPAAARSSRRPWSARQSSSCSRSENSSPGSSWRLHTEQRKHSMWYTLSRARITRSLLLKPTWHWAHLMPNSLRARARRASAQGPESGTRGRVPPSQPKGAEPRVPPAHLT